MEERSIAVTASSTEASSRRREPAAAVSSSESSSCCSHPLDQGHRYGNFHNYYAFYPPSARMTVMDDIVDYIGNSWIPTRPEKQAKVQENHSSPVDSTTHKQQQVSILSSSSSSSSSSSTLSSQKKKLIQSFTYLDVGCNEGDLTMEVANALQLKLDTTVQVTGIDIDGVLIDRANKKYNGNEDAKPMANVTAQFEVTDVCSTDQLQQATASMVDLTTLFSTTMWIHVHVGDQGLANVLQRLCEKTRHFFIIEPQPSKCYRNAMIRLRKLGRPELDVSSNRLAFRSNIAEAIETIVTKCGFQRVDLNHSKQSTCWNRSLQLYERKTPHMDSIASCSTIETSSANINIEGLTR